MVDGVVIGANATGDRSKAVGIGEDVGFHGVAEISSDLTETVATVVVARNDPPLAVNAIFLMMA